MRFTIVPSCIIVERYQDLIDLRIKKDNDEYKIKNYITNETTGPVYSIKKKDDEKDYILKMAYYDFSGLFREQHFYTKNYKNIPNDINIIKFDNFGLDITVGGIKQRNIIVEKKRNCLNNIDLFFAFSFYSVSTFNKFCIKIIKCLEYINSINYVHGDVKPGNIVFDDIEEPFLIDFGNVLKIKKYQRDVSEEELIAQPEDKILGTIPYMSIDAICGLRSMRTDLEGFGYILYQILEKNQFPWSTLTDLSDILDMKLKFIKNKNKEYMSNKTLIDYFNIIHKKKYNETPCYNELYKLFQN